MSFILRKLTERRIWRRIWEERLVESFHLNLASLFILMFGDFRLKVDYDLIIRPNHAWGLLKAADMAVSQGIKKLTAIEFGVANGAGLVNMARVARRVTKETGVEFDIVGFDTGTGMPAPRDYRDHPEHYFKGDYPTEDKDHLQAALPPNVKIIWGDISETVPKFLFEASDCVGFVSFDVDYYWSTIEAMKILEGGVRNYMPWVVLYFDDIQYVEHNKFAGQLLAIEDFNRSNEFRSIDLIRALSQTRLFRRSRWVYQMYLAHIFDHPAREESIKKTGNVILSNPYL